MIPLVLALTTAAFLDATPLVESDHPRIRALAAELGAGAASPREHAVRIHDSVRDEIAFGWTASFYRMRATEVLDAGVGYCNTKSTLFVALLRAAGIPARQRFVDVSSRVLDPFVARGAPVVDHSFTEVHLDGRWLKVDSYVVDRPLFDRARAALERSGASMGHGIHAAGTPIWDGRSDAFVQWLGDARVGRDHGVFADVAAFYAEPRGGDRLVGANRFLIPLFIGRSTAAVETFRGGR